MSSQKLLKATRIFLETLYICQNFNDAIDNIFSKILKNADVSPVFKEGMEN